MTPALLSLVAAALCGGAALLFLSRYMPRHREWRLWHVACVLAAVILLNLLAVPTFFMGYYALVLIPAACFVIGAIVAAVSPTYGWLIGAIASPWFIIGGIAASFLTSPPEAVDGTRGMWEVITILLGCGLIGSICGECASYFVVVDENA